MKLPLINRLSKEGLPAQDLPGWIDAFISMLNGMLEPLAVAVRGKLTFRDNFLCDIKTYTMSHATPLKIAVKNQFQVVGVLPLAAQKSTDPGTSTANVIAGWGIVSKQAGEVLLVVNFAGGKGVQASVTWAIFYG